MRPNNYFTTTVHEFSEITQNKGHYAVQGHLRSPVLVQIDFLLVINTNLPSILNHFRDIAFDRSKSLYLALAFNHPDGGVPYIISPEVIYH